MSLPPPPPPLNTTTAPLPQTTTTAPPPLPLTSGTAPSPVPIITAEEPLPILSPEAISGTLRELVQAVRGISLYLAGTQPPPPSVAHTTYGPPSLPWATPAFQPLHGGAPPPPPQLLLQHYHAAGTPWPVWPATTAPLGGCPNSRYRPPRRRLRRRTSSRRRHRQQHLQRPEPPVGPCTRCSSRHRHRQFPRGQPDHLRQQPTSAAPGHGGPTSPRFAKLNFTTYDGAEDPLNWLNQCEQFFRGQRTLASDRTWLASYHLRGTAQTWYYALEQDEGGMPPWDRFRELCLLRFGPPIRAGRLAALGRLPFTSTVQDYADRFQALACHAPGISGTSTPSR
ncbi:hypothetical protein ZWY2020_055194 [Hordeum vulgare]|nr:hypothetical protein ZWY2020_055194 [Hordeum vulgare]